MNYLDIFLVIICPLPLRCCEMNVTVLPGQVLWPVNFVHIKRYECENTAGK